MTPERRVVLVNFRNNRFCAEAPTEVGIDVATLNKVRAALSHQEQVSGGVESVGATANQNAVLNRRTQGVHLFLANAYFICQMYMNGGIDEAQMVEFQLRTLNTVTPLIDAELKYLYKEDQLNHATPKTQPQMENSIKSSKEEADAVLKNKSASPEESPKPKDGK